METMMSQEQFYAMDSKMRSNWSSSTSPYVNGNPTGLQVPSSSVYSHSGDSNSEYKHSRTEGQHEDFEGNSNSCTSMIIDQMKKTNKQMRNRVFYLC